MYMISKQEQIQDEASLAFIREIYYAWYISSSLGGLGSIAAAQGRASQAARLWRAAVSLRDAIAPPAAPAAKSLASYPAGLSEREVEVLCLVTQGFTNPQIAEHLFISLHTVNAHMRSIFNKLGVNSRAAAARFATEHRLV